MVCSCLYNLFRSSSAENLPTPVIPQNSEEAFFFLPTTFQAEEATIFHLSPQAHGEITNRKVVEFIQCNSDIISEKLPDLAFIVEWLTMNDIGSLILLNRKWANLNNEYRDPENGFSMLISTYLKSISHQKIIYDHELPRIVHNERILRIPFGSHIHNFSLKSSVNIQHFKIMTNLTTLNIDLPLGMQSPNCINFEAIAYYCPFLQTLNCADYALQTFLNINALSSLTSLSLYGKVALWDWHINDHFSNLNKLQNLDISFHNETYEWTSWENFTGTSFSTLTNLIELKRLRFSNYTSINDEGVSLLSSLTTLQTLEFVRADNLTGSSFLHFTALKNLTHLNLTMCRSITDDTLPYLRSLTQLSRLILTDTSITQDAGAELYAQLKAEDY